MKGKTQDRDQFNTHFIPVDHGEILSELLTIAQLVLKICCVFVDPFYALPPSGYITVRAAIT